MDTREKVELFVVNGGGETVHLECKGLGNEVVFTQDSMSEVNRLKITECGKDRRWGNIECNIQGRLSGIPWFRKDLRKWE
jgi:hypothetical protein